MNGNKRSLVLDLASARGTRPLRGAGDGADAIIETRRPGTLDALGLGYERLRAAHPRLVMTSITSFGQRGPRRDWAAATSWRRRSVARCT